VQRIEELSLHRQWHRQWQWHWHWQWNWPLTGLVMPGFDRRFGLLAAAAVLLGGAAAMFHRSESTSDAGAEVSSDTQALAPETNRVQLPAQPERKVSALPMLKLANPPPADVELDPAAPGYDPQRLLAIVDPDELFRAEPRSAAWADQVESVLGPVLLRELKTLVPQVVSVDLGCKTTMCVLRWEVDSDDRIVLDNTRELARQIFPGTGQLVRHGRNFERFTLFEADHFKGDRRDAESFIAAASDHASQIARFFASPKGQKALAMLVGSSRP
jgi:hypothetical protein